MRHLAALLLLLPSLAAAADLVPSVPKQFRGEWNQVLSSCGSGDHESALRIDANTIEFYESEGPIKAVVVHGRYELALIAELSGEGETWLATHQFHLSPGMDKLIVGHGSDDEYVRYRCPARAAKR